MTLQYDEELFEKLKFDAWEKEKFSHSLWGKVAAVEGHGATRRPWEAFALMMAKAVLKSDTTLAMAEIGISLHAAKSKEMYSVQFVSADACVPLTSCGLFAMISLLVIKRTGLWCRSLNHTRALGV